MKNRSEEWQQLFIQDKAERPEPIKSENGGNELKKRVWGMAAALHPRQSGLAETGKTGNWWKRTFKTEKRNVKRSKPSASWKTGTGLNDRVFMQAL